MPLSMIQLLNDYSIGQSVYLDEVSKRDIIAYQYVPNDAFGGPSYLGINYLDFSSGWPVLTN